MEATASYAPENAPCFVHFDSLDDLVVRLASTDYEARRAALKAWAEAHTNTTLSRWRMLDDALFGGWRERATSRLPNSLTHFTTAVYSTAVLFRLSSFERTGCRTLLNLLAENYSV